MTSRQSVADHIRSNVVGYIALFCFAIGGTAQALPGKNTVDSGDIKRANVKKADVAANAIVGTKVADDSLGGPDIDEQALNSAVLQRRIQDSCATSQAIRAVAADGSVTCEPISVASGAPSGPAGGALTGTYPDPGLAAGAVTSTTLAPNLLDVLDANDIATGGVSDAELNDDLANTIDANDIASDGVGGSELAPNSVGTTEVSLDSLIAEDIAVGAVGSSEVATDAIGSSEVATDAIGFSEVATDAIGSSEVATDAVSSSEVVDGSIGSAEIGAGAVGTSEVGDGSLRGTDISSAGSSIALGGVANIPSGSCREIASVTPNLTTRPAGSLVWWVEGDTPLPTGLFMIPFVVPADGTTPLITCNPTGVDIDPPGGANFFERRIRPTP